MASNQYTNKVVLADGTVLIDLTQDNVTAADVLAGKSFHLPSGQKVTGTSPFDMDTSEMTAVAAEILDGKTAGVNGQTVVGSMPNRGGQVGAVTDKNTPVTIQQGYHDGSGSVGIDATEKAKLIAENIKAGITVLGVTGSYSGDTVTVQSKTATPYMTAQTVLPDAGYDYLSQVTIEPIAISEVDNAQGGKTVTIGTAAPV